MTENIMVGMCPYCGKEVQPGSVKCGCGYYFDQNAYKQAVEKREKFAKDMEVEKDDKGFFAAEKKGINAGVLGGIVMIVIAVVWFVVGYAAGRIFYYPPILCIIGIYAVIKGLATGNLSGKKKEA
jgi:hypothetical protein